MSVVYVLPRRPGLKRIPAYVREAGDDNMLELALVENIQREDLDAIEVAISYQRLIEEFNLTQEGLGDTGGKETGHHSQLPEAFESAGGDTDCHPGERKSPWVMPGPW